MKNQLAEVFRRVLVLAPHTDDGEIGAGGLISKLTDTGAVVHYAAFSICEESVPEGFPKDILSKEVLAATSVLGISEENVFISRFKVRHFGESRQGILDNMIKLRGEIQPDLILMPSKYDCHQDHITIHQEGVRAFRSETMLGYEMPWNSINFEANLLVELNEQNVTRKIQALEMYHSQSFRNYGPEKFRVLAEARGLQNKMKYAEAYNIIRWIWK